jgi:hypothetical protein
MNTTTVRENRTADRSDQPGATCGSESTKAVWVCIEASTLSDKRGGRTVRKKKMGWERKKVGVKRRMLG